MHKTAITIHTIYIRPQKEHSATGIRKPHHFQVAKQTCTLCIIYRREWKHSSIHSEPRNQTGRVVNLKYQPLNPTEARPLLMEQETGWAPGPL
jgi:hypothetical protein